MDSRTETIHLNCDPPNAGTEHLANLGHLSQSNQRTSVVAEGRPEMQIKGSNTLGNGYLALRLRQSPVELINYLEIVGKSN
jgi:hypothetical protein